MMMILGHGSINFFDGVITDEEVRKLFEYMKKHEAFMDVKQSGRYISFIMDGNHNIDYTELDKIKQEFINKKAHFSIMVSEWVESDENYYFSSDDEQVIE